MEIFTVVLIILRAILQRIFNRHHFQNAIKFIHMEV